MAAARRRKGIVPAYPQVERMASVAVAGRQLADQR